MTSGERVWSHSPIPSIDTQSMDESSVPGFTLSDVSSLKSVSSGSEQSIDRLVLSDSDKKLRHVVYLIEEMINTEQTYIDALTDVTQGYIVKIREGKETGFTEDIISEAFVNIENIRDFHIELLNHLNGCNKEHKLIAEVFIKNIAKFEMYIEFCSNFPRSLERLGQLHRDEPSKSFLAGCQNALGHIFPVEEYLHRAVQRVLKYPLLFRDMAKKLVDLDDHKIVEEALSKVLVTAVKINAVKRVQELQSKELIGWDGGDLSLKGDLLLEDSFKLLGAKDPRFLFLFQKSLLVTKARHDGTFIYKKEIMMDNVTLKEQVSGDFLKWEIMESKGNDGFTLQAKDGVQKEAWVREVKRCIIDSTPGLTDQMKETLLFKLPSLNDHSQQIDKIWKGMKGLKKKENVQIIHNPDNPIINDDPMKTFGWAPPDSYSDKNNQMISRPGKRKLTKKKSNALKISHPVQNISEEKTRSAENSPKQERIDKNVQRSESDPHRTEKKPCLEKSMTIDEIKSETGLKVVQRDISPYVDQCNPMRRRSPDLIDTLDFDQIKAHLMKADRFGGVYVGADTLSTVKPSRPAPPPPPKSAPPPLKNTRSQSPSVIDIARSMKAPAPQPPQQNSPPSQQIVSSPPPSRNISSPISTASLGSTSPTPESISPLAGSTSSRSVSISPPLGSASQIPPGNEDISVLTEDEVTLETSSNISAISSESSRHTTTDKELSPREDFQSHPVLQSAEHHQSSPQRTKSPPIKSKSPPIKTKPPPVKTKPTKSSPTPTATSLPLHESTSLIKHSVSEVIRSTSPKQSPLSTSSPASSTTITNLPTAEEIETLLEDSLLEETVVDICDKVLEHNSKANNVPSSHDKGPVVEPKMECEKPVSAVRPVQQVKPTIKSGDSITSESMETSSYIDIDNSKQLNRATGGMSRKSAIKKKKPNTNMDKNTACMTSESTEPTTTIEEPEFSKEKMFEEDEVIDTGISALMQYGAKKIMDSPYHPLPLLGIVYIIACLLFSLPIWITIPTGAVTAIILYKLSPPHPDK